MEDKTNEIQKQNFKEKPELGAEICQTIDFCAGLSQNERGDIFLLETVFFQDYVKDENWTTVVLLSAKDNQLKDEDPLNLDLCCPEQPKIPFIKLGRREVPMQVRHTMIVVTVFSTLFSFLSRLRELLAICPRNCSTNSLWLEEYQSYWRVVWTKLSSQNKEEIFQLLGLSPLMIFFINYSSVQAMLP